MTLSWTFTCVEGDRIKAGNEVVSEGRSNARLGVLSLNWERYQWGHRGTVCFSEHSMKSGASKRGRALSQIIWMSIAESLVSLRKYLITLCRVWVNPTPFSPFCLCQVLPAVAKLILVHFHWQVKQIVDRYGPPAMNTSYFFSFLFFPFANSLSTTVHPLLYVSLVVSVFIVTRLMGFFCPCCLQIRVQLISAAVGRPGAAQQLLQISNCE